MVMSVVWLKLLSCGKTTTNVPQFTAFSFISCEGLGCDTAATNLPSLALQLFGCACYRVHAAGLWLSHHWCAFGLDSWHDWCSSWWFQLLPKQQQGQHGPTSLGRVLLSEGGGATPDSGELSV